MILDSLALDVISQDSGLLVRKDLSREGFWRSSLNAAIREGERARVFYFFWLLFYDDPKLMPQGD
jgi:hypothetical protein